MQTSLFGLPKTHGTSGLTITSPACIVEAAGEIEEKPAEMAAASQHIIRIVYCYAHQDKGLRDELDKHLEPLKRSGQITTWHDRDMQPGTEWKREIASHLDGADLVLLLVSPDFLRSDYCYGVEMQRALEKHDAGGSQGNPGELAPGRLASHPSE